MPPTPDNFFMVSLEKGKDQLEPSTQTIKEEQDRFKDLMREQLLQQVFMNESRKKVWLVLKTDSKEIVKEIVETLPICSRMRIAIDPLIWN